MDKEIWKDVVGYEGLYEISTEGRVKRLSRWITDSMGRNRFLEEKILVNRISKQTRYPCVNLSKDGKVTTINIHTLIADAFIPNPQNLPCINHIDEDRAHSVLSNLERCDYAYNNMYGTAPIRRRASLRKYYEGNGREPRGIQYGTNLSVSQFTINGDFVARFEGGAPEVEKVLGFKKVCIGACCRHTSRIAYGYVWRYDGDPFSYSEPQYNKGKDFSNCKPKTHQKYVILIDDNGNEIKRYKSVSQAGKENGFDRHYFSRTKPVNGITTIKGLRFIVEKKANEYIPNEHHKNKVICKYLKEGDLWQKV